MIDGLSFALGIVSGCGLVVAFTGGVMIWLALKH